MTQRMNLILVVAIFLLLGGVVLAQPGTPGASLQYTVQQGAASGGDYQLTSLTWQASGSASGGRYLLLHPAAANLRGSGCCCLYLPLILRGFR